MSLTQWVFLIIGLIPFGLSIFFLIRLKKSIIRDQKPRWLSSLGIFVLILAAGFLFGQVVGVKTHSGYPRTGDIFYGSYPLHAHFALGDYVYVVIDYHTSIDETEGWFQFRRFDKNAVTQVCKNPKFLNVKNRIVTGINKTAIFKQIELSELQEK